MELNDIDSKNENKIKLLIIMMALYEVRNRSAYICINAKNHVKNRSIGCRTPR